MRLEYLPDVGPQLPDVLLLYGDEPADAEILRLAAERLAAGRPGFEVRIDQLANFYGVDDCSLAASVGSLDLGVEALDGSERAFRCVLCPRSWKRVAGLIEPFAETKRTARHGHQYLTAAGAIDWIVSTDLSW
jgi:hypothetical protein